MRIDVKQYSHDFITMPSITICVGYKIISKLTNFDEVINTKTSLDKYLNRIHILDIFKYEILNKFFECEFYGQLGEKFSNTSCDSMSKPINSLYIDRITHKKCFTFFNQKLEAKNPINRMTVITINNSYFLELKNDILIEHFGKFLITIHSQINPYNFGYWNEYNSIQLQNVINLLVTIKRTSTVYMNYPFSNCINYDKNSSPFNSLSNEDCIRKCIQNYCYRSYNCSLWTIANIISELDEGYDNLKPCNSELSKICSNDKFYDECNLLCPKDCIQESYYLSIINLTTSSCTKVSIVKLEWDDKQPIISYIETPVITFIEYICYIGGLLGIWFGFSIYSLNNLIQILLNRFKNLFM
jgi:hypothetical protein